MNSLFNQIPGAEKWQTIQPINKGWSEDKKFFIQTNKGEKYLLRISNKESLQEEKVAYEAMKRLGALDLPIPGMVQAGLCNDHQHTYRLFTWVEGKEAREVLPRFSAEKQFELGYQAGKILKQIHQISAPENHPDWSVYFNQKIDRNIRRFYQANNQFPSGEIMIRFLENHRYLLENRSQCFLHGDFHIGNMVISDSGQLGIIDFNRLDFGDPWEEFNRIIWCAGESTSFASGRIKGYFDGEPVPDSFFKYLALYVCSNQLGGLFWAEQFGESEVDTFLTQTVEVMGWFDDFNKYVPAWYVPYFS